MPEPLGSNALRRLGKRIGSRETLNEVDSTLYRALISDAEKRTTAVRSFTEVVLAAVVGTIDVKPAEFEVTGRVKTLSTLADKLERPSSGPLQSVHDVAGVRAVFKDISFLEQTLITHALAAAFDADSTCVKPSLIVDRIESPSFGYRAIHLIAWPHGRPVEIQLRTELQHAWAQSMEIICDRWGREPRYGLPVQAPNDHEREERVAVIDLMLKISYLIGSVESTSSGVSLRRLATNKVVRPAMEKVMSKAQVAALSRPYPPQSEAVRQLEGVKASIREVLRVLDSLQGG